jgi:hypothetical protein
MKFGIEGYGLYYACVEIIAGALTTENITFELDHDAEILAHKFKIDTIKVENIMKYCVESGLFNINKQSKKIICVSLFDSLDNTMSQAPEVKKVLGSEQAKALRNFKKLEETCTRIDEIRLDENRIELEENRIQENISAKADKCTKQITVKQPGQPSLHKSIMEAFHSKYGPMETYAREGRAVTELIRRAELKRGEIPLDQFIPMMIAKFWELINDSREKFFYKQPFKPSTLAGDAIWSRVLTQLQDAPVEDIGEIF